MRQYKHNLVAKKLTDFTKEDTIYIADMKDQRGMSHLCQFISYDRKTAMVTGKVIEASDEREQRMHEGKILAAKYNRCALYGNATDDVDRAYFRHFDHSLYAMHPLEEHKVVENDVHVEKHPSYGLARFSRISSSHPRALFGSSIQNKQTITFTISRAKHHRSLNNDHYFAESELIEIEMSQTQFAELITSFNMGSGIPVTIKHIQHDIYPEPPFLSQMDIFSNEFRKSMNNFSVDMKILVEQATEILNNKQNIGKGDREVIMNCFQKLTGYLGDKVPFIADQFMESMEYTVTQAKGEIEAFIENKIRNTGLEGLGFKKEDHTPLLINPDKSEEATDAELK